MKIMRNSTGVTALVAAMVLGGCASVAAHQDTPAPLPGPVAPAPAAQQVTPIRPAEQWLFGSAEASVIIRHTYDAMTHYAVTAAKTRD